MATKTSGSRVDEVRPASVFDCAEFFAALDEHRCSLGLDWNNVAVEMYGQSSELNAQLMDHAICPGAVVRVARRGSITCQYALYMLRWMDRAPEDFVTAPVVDVGDVRLPQAGTDSRLRWDLHELYAELDVARTELGLTWARLARSFECSPSRLTNLRTARLADMDLVMRITQWLGRPAAAFIHPAGW